MITPVGQLMARAGRLSRALTVAVAGGVVWAVPGASAQVTVVNESALANLNPMHVPDSSCIPFGQAWMTGGLAVGDFNNDSWPDVFVVAGGQGPDKLYINDGDGTFTDQAAAWGVNVWHGGNGVSVADYNNDGWQDIYVTSFGPPGRPGVPGQHKLYRNNGNGTFTDVAVAAGVNQTTLLIPNGYGSAWGDYDLDGDLDLFVASWRDSNSGNNGTGNKLFRNNGNNTFTNVSVASGIALAMQGVWGFQPAFVDMNGDHYPEILMAADFQTSRYLINDTDGTFTDATIPSGTGIDDNGMGQTVGDFDNNQLLDWYVTSIHQVPPNPGQTIGNMLYMNQGDDSYLETSISAGVNDGGWGWGTVAVDLDHDGWQDLIEVNGRNAGQWANEREYLFRNDGDGTFTEIGIPAGLDLAGDARAIAWLDADRDGDQDVVITVNTGQMRYYRNTTSNANSWIRLTFDNDNNPALPPNGFGARVEVLADELDQVQYFSGSPTYLATCELALHFGLGDAKLIDSIEVHWPTGQVSSLTNVAPNQFLHIPAPEPADITANGSVNVDDLLAVINSWGACPAPAAVCAADADNNGTVNVDDLLAVINNWG